MGYTQGISTASWVGNWTSYSSLNDRPINGVTRSYVDGSTIAGAQWTEYMRAVAPLYATGGLTDPNRVPAPSPVPEQDNEPEPEASREDPTPEPEPSSAPGAGEGAGEVPEPAPPAEPEVPEAPAPTAPAPAPAPTAVPVPTQPPATALPGAPGE